MFRFSSPTFKPVLQQSGYRESHHKRELRHSLEKKFPWVGKTRNSPRFYCKKRTTQYSLNTTFAV